jgi:hypothetical protein
MMHILRGWPTARRPGGGAARITACPAGMLSPGEHNLCHPNTRGCDNCLDRRVLHERHRNASEQVRRPERPGPRPLTWLSLAPGVSAMTFRSQEGRSSPPAHRLARFTTPRAASSRHRSLRKSAGTRLPGQEPGERQPLGVGEQRADRRERGRSGQGGRAHQAPHETAGTQEAGPPRVPAMTDERNLRRVHAERQEGEPHSLQTAEYSRSALGGLSAAHASQMFRFCTVLRHDWALSSRQMRMLG